MLDNPHIYYEEECWLDMSKRLMRLSSKPVGFDNYAVMEETSTFSPVAENPHWYTNFKFKQNGTTRINALLFSLLKGPSSSKKELYKY